jgi:type 1 glutamine amidotransferase
MYNGSGSLTNRRRIMVKRRAVTLSLMALLLGLPAWAADNAAPKGFVSLFNGKDLHGWKVPAGDNGHWKVVDGVIDYDAQSEAPGDKSLWSDRAYGNFILQVDWRLKEAPFLNKNIPYILPDGAHARDIHGKEMRMALPDADSGVFLRGDGRFQVNIWCWPIGSGEMYGIRTDPAAAPALRTAATPRTQADRPVGQWNHFEITARGKTVKVVLNGKTVIPGATIPDLPARGRLAFQHHGGKNKKGAWSGPPSLVQFKNIYIRELPQAATGSVTPPAHRNLAQPRADVVRALLITGGHDHETSFYRLFHGYDDLARMPVTSSTAAFQGDLRDKYDVLVMYDFSRDLTEAGKENLRAFVASGKGIVVLHHALLNYQTWPWWYEDVVGGSYRLRKEGSLPSSTYKGDQKILVTPAGEHPITRGLGPFQAVDETYKHMWISPKVRPLLTTDNPNGDRLLAWIGPCATSRVVAIQLGHGPTVFSHPGYRALVHNAILWAGGRLK